MYRDPARQALAVRGYKRTCRHGNWRQTYIDCKGMCQYPVNSSICGATENLEFHEPFGEIHGAKIKFQQRVLLCTDHHSELEGVQVQEMIISKMRPSMLSSDVALEIYLAGSYRLWLDRYKLRES